MYRTVLLLSVLGLGLLGPSPSMAQSDPLDGYQAPTARSVQQPETTSRVSPRKSRSFWRFFNRPEKDTPRAQIEYAKELEDAGKDGKALKALKRLVSTWPDALEAAYAQLGIGRMLDRQGELEKAFEAYQVLMTEYAGRFPSYEHVLERQFLIAKKLMEKRKAKFFFLPGFYAPERAVPLFEEVIRNGPNWKGAAESQYLIGKAYQANDKYEEAIIAYSTVQQRYPTSSFAEEASFQGGKCFYLIAKENPNSQADQEKAWAALTLFIQNYPASEHLAQAETYREELFGRMAKAAYDRAHYYDEIAGKPRAALVMYRDFVKRFPSSAWTPAAQTRIDSLEITLPPEEN